jgi:negative regulator of sigma-B (phosphoserine phosphatase)
MLRIAHRTVPHRNETQNGDAVVVRVDPSGKNAMVAVIDGLGHGPHAAEVAARAVEHLEAGALDRAAIDVMEGLHAVLRGTRGAAATVCVVEGHSLTACGVGNVSLRTRGTNVPFVLSPGILGARVRSLRPVACELRGGDRLVLHSDGVGSGFSLETLGHLDADGACASIFEAFRKPTDDATVLVLDVEA